MSIQIVEEPDAFGVQVLSDLHLELADDFGSGLIDSLDFSGADVVIFAGDIVQFGGPPDTVVAAQEALCSLCAKIQKPVFYVPGNHEYYFTDPNTVVRILSECKESSPNLNILGVNAVYSHLGRRFLGGTLWFPDVDGRNAEYSRLIKDFRYIKSFVPWVYEQNAATTAFLNHEVRRGDIVITHHVPSPRCLPQSGPYKDHDINRFYLSDMTETILWNEPELWVCGHTHCSSDIMVGATRVICNPHGNPHTRQSRIYNRHFIIEC